MFAMIIHYIHYHVWLPEGTVALLRALKIFKVWQFIQPQLCCQQWFQLQPIYSYLKATYGLIWQIHE